MPGYAQRGYGAFGGEVFFDFDNSEIKSEADPFKRIK
jgi:hypothetical protein